MDYLNLFLGPAVTAVSIFLSFLGICRQQRTKLYSHYSRLYYDIMLDMINNSENKEKCEKIAEVYIDLCSEEFQLHKKGKVDDDTWKQWCDGIRYLLKQEPYFSVWQQRSQDDYYDDDFVTFIKEHNNE